MATVDGIRVCGVCGATLAATEGHFWRGEDYCEKCFRQTRLDDHFSAGPQRAEALAGGRPGLVILLQVVAALAIVIGLFIVIDGWGGKEYEPYRYLSSFKSDNAFGATANSSMSIQRVVGFQRQMIGGIAVILVGAAVFGLTELRTIADRLRK